MLQVCSLLTLVGCISVTPHKSMPHAHAHTPHTRTHITHIRHVCVCPAAPPKLGVEKKVHFPVSQAHTHTRAHTRAHTHICIHTTLNAHVCSTDPPKLEDVLTSRKAIQRVKAAAHEATTNVDERGYEVCVVFVSLWCVHVCVSGGGGGAAAFEATTYVDERGYEVCVLCVQ